MSDFLAGYGLFVITPEEHYIPLSHPLLVEPARWQREEHDALSYAEGEVLLPVKHLAAQSLLDASKERRLVTVEWITHDRTGFRWYSVVDGKIELTVNGNYYACQLRLYAPQDHSQIQQPTWTKHAIEMRAEVHDALTASVKRWGTHWLPKEDD